MPLISYTMIRTLQLELSIATLGCFTTRRILFGFHGWPTRSSTMKVFARVEGRLQPCRRFVRSKLFGF